MFLCFNNFNLECSYLGKLQWWQVQKKNCNGRRCNKGTSQGQNVFIYKLVSLQSSWIIFANLHVLTLITLFCDFAFKIKSLLSMVSSMSRVVQWWSIGIFLLLKICMNLDFYFITINNYRICLWVHECQCIKDWNVASYNGMKFLKAIWHHTDCHAFHRFQCSLIFLAYIF